MVKHGPSIRVDITGKEHASEYAARNAEAFIELGKAVADVYEVDYDELKIMDKDHYLLIEEDGEISPYSLRGYDSVGNCSDYGSEELVWDNALSLEEFEEMFETIRQNGAEIYRMSRDAKSQIGSENGKFESFGKTSLSFKDAEIPLMSESRDINTLFKAARNSGTELDPSPFQLAKARAGALLTSQTADELLLEHNQSDEAGYAELELKRGWVYEDGFDEIAREEVEEIVENVSGFEAEYVEPESSVMLED